MLDWTPATSGNATVYTILNGYLQTGANPFYVYCKDAASNVSYKTGSITKTIPILSMNGLVDGFGDFDMDNNGLDGRDISITWQKPAGDISNFYSYQLYVLPFNVDFNEVTHGNKYIAYIQDENTVSFTGGVSITKDSTDTTLVSGASYKACVAIR